MPDSFAHVTIANQALLRSGQLVANHPCFTAGANGPDPLYFWQFGRKRKNPDLPAIARRIHREKTGQFLNALLYLSLTPEQQSYTMGFLTHYSTDCTLNPFISGMGDKGMFKGKKGRRAFETSIDSELFFRQYRQRAVPMFISTPQLIAEDMSQVATLLHDAIWAVYKEDIPVVALSDCFHEYAGLRKKITSPSKLNRGITRLLAPLQYGKQADDLVGRMQPGKPLLSLPQEWKNPYSTEDMHLTFDEVVALAESTGAALIVAAMGFWLGGINDDEISSIIGDNNYYTGRPAKPPAQPQDDSPKETSEGKRAVKESE